MNVKKLMRAIGWEIFILLCGSLAGCHPVSNQAVGSESVHVTLPPPQQIQLPSLTPFSAVEISTATFLPENRLKSATLPAFFQTPTLKVVSGIEPDSKEYDVPLVTQDDLKYKGVKTTLGCTAASVQMVLDYWKTINPDYKTISAQKIIDINTSQGTFRTGEGLSIENVKDELQNIGYVLEIYQNSDKEQLLSIFDEFGPQILLVKTGWVPTGANHLVVLVAYDKETDTVTVNDPWFDHPFTWDWEAFDGIWSLNYSQKENGYLTRSFFNIRPASLSDNSD